MRNIAIAESTANDPRLNKEGYEPERLDRGFPGQPSRGNSLLKPKDYPPAGSKGAFGPPQSRRRMKVPSGWDTEPGSRGTIHRTGRNKGNSKTFRGGGIYINNQSFDNSSVTERKSHGNKPNETGKRNRRSVWSIATSPFKEAHFATFPPKLIEPCILAGCPEDGVVINPFARSGTVGLVAYKFRRNFILIDIKKEYCDMANRRVKKEMAQIRFEI